MTQLKIYKFIKTSNIIKPQINNLKIKFYLVRKSIDLSKREIEI